MSSELMERIKEHFDAKGVKEIKVPEWGTDGQPLVIYCAPFNLDEKNRIRKKAMGGNEIAANAFILTLKALDKDSKPLSTKKEEPNLLTHANTGVVARVVDQ